ncbi:TetR/AcrR family transcriptional regulator C-terminal domain-containing protein [Paractinoplanes ferrugineus]|uniref:TetR family transcriptional regulator n=1 Tax=Paractinoplanes ferrugineus TaxID=113564 RepID=A0A919IZE6_9ACTN|nr:TetR/AcrR family transcriptional regulator C-terminal domain-containing protein [Actinoplanes ferrugineus]GIE10934.1 TetR family transcriptional regulator [Actinoplanes ferrugineus]
MARRSPSAGIPARANSRLSRAGIVAAAVELADREGLAGFSMRKLAQALEVDAMSIYYHVHDKGTLLACMADAVTAEIVAAPSAGPWTARLRALIMAAREVMLRHPWAVRVIEGGDTPTPAVLMHIERVLAIMRAGDCPVDLGHHAIHLLGSRILGFSQDLFADKPGAAPPPPGAFDALPHVGELAAEASHSGTLGGCDDDVEFAFALDLILDGLERRRTSQ